MKLLKSGCRLAIWLGVDRNPVRRRTDKIASCLAIAAITAFGVGAPLAAVAAGRWQARATAAERQAELSWREVPAVLTAAPQPTGIIYWSANESLALARWTAPDGRSWSGTISAPPGAKAGAEVRVWVDQAGRPTGPPISEGAVRGHAIAAAMIAVVALALALLLLYRLVRWPIDRRRLADWGSDWEAVEPQWTKRFRSQA